jgi:hypothetical protein
MKVRKFCVLLRLLGDPGRHGLPPQGTQGRQAPLCHGRSRQFGYRLDQRNPVDSSRSEVIRHHSFACQMAGADYYNFGKTGGKGLNRLE